MIPQPDCKRDTNYKSHGITKGITFCGAVIRTYFEKEKGVDVTPAGQEPPRRGEFVEMTPPLFQYLREPDTGRHWTPWQGS